jgi:hypothetical protein
MVAQIVKKFGDEPSGSIRTENPLMYLRREPGGLSTVKLRYTYLCQSIDIGLADDTDNATLNILSRYQEGRWCPWQRSQLLLESEQWSLRTHEFLFVANGNWMLVMSDCGLENDHAVSLGNTQFWLIIKKKRGQIFVPAIRIIRDTDLSSFHCCMCHAITHDDTINW